MIVELLLSILVGIVVVILGLNAYFRLEAKYLSTLNELRRLRDDTPTQKEIVPLDGIFETHITVDPKHNFVQLLKYIKANEKQHSIKPVFACSSNLNNQYMISHFTRKKDEGEAIDFANRLAKEMKQDYGIKVQRVKVESHGAKGIPHNTADYELFCDYLKKRYHGKAGQPYFEFHVKVSSHRTLLDYYQRLEDDVKEMKGVAISYNLCSKSRHPLLTIRCYGVGFLKAQQYKDQVMNQLKQLGYVFEDQIQQEFSVYDSNAELDKGWLITE